MLRAGDLKRLLRLARSLGRDDDYVMQFLCDFVEKPGRQQHLNNFGYLSRALKNRSIDDWRLARRRQRRTIRDLPEFRDWLGSGRDGDVFVERLDNPGSVSHSWAAIAKRTGSTEPAVRKRFERRCREAEAKMVLGWWVTQQFDLLNEFRLPLSVVARATELGVARGVPKSTFCDGLGRPEWHRACQNSIWAIHATGDHHQLGGVLRSEKYFRGSVMSATEAMLLRAPNSEEYLRSYVRRLHFFRSRAVWDQRPKPEQDVVRDLCIFEQLPFRPIFLPRAEARGLIKRYESGVEDVDLHRTLAWTLLRVRAPDVDTVSPVLHLLGSEEDQTNAYYVAKFAIGVLRRQNPRVVDTPLFLRSLALASSKWRAHPYLREQRARLAKALKVAASK